MVLHTNWPELGTLKKNQMAGKAEGVHKQENN